LIADKTFDADAFHRRPQRSSDRPQLLRLRPYCEHNLIERFFNKLKHFRATVTRYDKLTKIFFAGGKLACAAILLN
jgi:transposase